MIFLLILMGIIDLALFMVFGTYYRSPFWMCLPLVIILAGTFININLGPATNYNFCLYNHSSTSSGLGHLVLGGTTFTYNYYNATLNSYSSQSFSEPQVLNSTPCFTEQKYYSSSFSIGWPEFTVPLSGMNQSQFNEIINNTGVKP